jgi:RNA polymerase sigma-70 factor (ECF subfamily)
MTGEDQPDAALQLARAAGGDMPAWGALLARHQERLREVITFRLDARLRGRIDAADVMQEAFITATARRAEFFAQSAQPLFLWLRWMVFNTLLELHRHHLGAQMRDARREISGRFSGGAAAAEDKHPRRTGGATDVRRHRTGHGRATRREERGVNQALDQMDAPDREVLALRHYEQLTTRRRRK